MKEVKEGRESENTELNPNSNLFLSAALLLQVGNILMSLSLTLKQLK